MPFRNRLPLLLEPEPTILIGKNYKVDVSFVFGNQRAKAG